MSFIVLDTNENLEQDLKLIKLYEDNEFKLEQFKLGKLSKKDPSFNKIKTLYDESKINQQRKSNILNNDKLLKYLKKIESKDYVKHKTNMKSYKK